LHLKVRQECHCLERNIMQENKQDKYEFISEKIKDKPVNKKKLAYHVCIVVLLAVLFGIVASVTFVLCQPKIDGMLHPKEDPAITIPKDEPEQETETEEPDTETETNEPDSEPQIVYEQLTLDDFQTLQNEMYAIGKQANKFIVAVTGVKSNTDWFNNAYESKGQGSGIIIANSGQELLILTERKVIAEASSVYVTFVNDTSVEASIKKYDGNTGITVLSVPVDEIDNDTMNLISVAVLGNSLAITQGTLALAVGSPLGTNYSILTGNITSSAYSISTIDANYDIFTTDIVGSKNGSGALINLNGEVIGIVTQGYSSEGDQNTLTAISISKLKPLIEMLSNNKDIPYIGLEITTVTNTIAKENDIPKGVYIKDVKMDSPAMAAGLQSGDVITEIDGEAVISVDGYQTKLLSLTPGDVANVTIQRQGNDGYTEIKCPVTVSVLQ
jgi:serine protease Do